MRPPGLQYRLLNAAAVRRAQAWRLPSGLSLAGCAALPTTAQTLLLPRRYTLLVIPAFAGYKLYGTLSAQWKAAKAAPAELDPAAKKQMDRAQARAERRRMKWR